jgi:ribonuclease P protein component
MVPMLHRYSFPSIYRLKSRKEIETLYSEGQSVFNHPFLVKYRIAESGTDFHETGDHLQIAFSVPKRVFQKATSRNRIKRLMREAFRLQFRDRCTLALTQKVSIMIVFIGKKEESFDTVQKSMIKILDQLEHLLSQTNTK